MRKVDSIHFNCEYFQRSCCDFEAFDKFDGTKLPSRLKKAYDLARLKEGKVVLDFACGRGELAIYIAKKGYVCHAVDYSSDALAMAKKKATEIGVLPGSRLYFHHCKDLDLADFSTNQFDVMFMIDIWEHLYPEQLDVLMQAVRRVLRPSGIVVIHTEPNLFLGRIASRFFQYQFFQNTVFQVLAWLNRQPEVYDDRIRLHVNEQTPKSLYNSLSRFGYQARVWTTQFHSLSEMLNFRIFLKKIIFHGFPITSMPLLRDYFNSNIWAVAKK